MDIDQNEIAEGFYEPDRVELFTAMTNRGVPQEAQDRILERIIEENNEIDRQDRVFYWLQDEGVNNADDIIVDWMLNHLTMDTIQEEYEYGENYTALQERSQG